MSKKEEAYSVGDKVLVFCYIEVKEGIIRKIDNQFGVDFYVIREYKDGKAVLGNNGLFTKRGDNISHSFKRLRGKILYGVEREKIAYLKREIVIAERKIAEVRRIIKERNAQVKKLAESNAVRRNKSVIDVFDEFEKKKKSASVKPAL